MRLKLSVVSCITLMYCVSYNGCVHVFVCATSTEVIAERWHPYGRVTEGVVMVLLTSVVYCRGMSVE
jgi:hypothetical protein